MEKTTAAAFKEALHAAFDYVEIRAKADRLSRSKSASDEEVMLKLRILGENGAVERFKECIETARHESGTIREDRTEGNKADE